MRVHIIGFVFCDFCGEGDSIRSSLGNTCVTVGPEEILVVHQPEGSPNASANWNSQVFSPRAKEPGASISPRDRVVFAEKIRSAALPSGNSKCMMMQRDFPCIHSFFLAT